MCERHYYRCIDCLTVSAAAQYVREATCGACSGRIEYMGRVEAERLKADVVVCKCDYRCTFARGPVCNCPCGGANHGQGILIEVTRDVGPVPRLTPKNPAAALAVATEYRTTIAKLTAEINAIEAKQRAEGRLSYADFARLNSLCKGRHLARKARVHKQRMSVMRVTQPTEAPTFASFTPTPKADRVPNIQPSLF